MKNITLSLDERLLMRVKVLAAEEGKAVSQLVAELLDERLKKKNRLRSAKKRSLARIGNPQLDLGGAPLSRDEAYER